MGWLVSILNHNLKRKLIIRERSVEYNLTESPPPLRFWNHSHSNRFHWKWRMLQKRIYQHNPFAWNWEQNYRISSKHVVLKFWKRHINLLDESFNNHRAIFVNFSLNYWKNPINGRSENTPLHDTSPKVHYISWLDYLYKQGKNHRFVKSFSVSQE